MPEKGLIEVTRAIREQYEKGVAAIHRNNVDYALSILTSVVQQEPGLYPAREALRDAQFRKAGNRGGFLKRWLGTASTSPLLAKAQIELRTNPRDALQTAEQVLNSDAHSVAAHKIVAQAATVLDFPKTALFSLQFAFRTSPDRDVALQLGEALAHAGQVEKAEAVLADLVRTLPNDPAIAQALKNLAAKRTMSEGGYGALESGRGSYRDVLKDHQETRILEDQNRGERSDEATARLVQDYESQLEREPQNVRVLRLLAEVHEQSRDHDRALACYQRIVELEGVAEPSLERIITQVTLRKYADRLAALDPQAADHVEAKARLEAERDAYELERMRRLVDQYPSDLGLRFELGQLHYQQGRMTEAIQEFQKAQNNPHKRSQALFYLGQCFARRGILDLAERTLSTAIRERPVFDEEKKELVYALANVLGQMGKKAEAIDQLKLIYEVDIGYRDVAARVDAHYSEGTGKPGTGRRETGLSG